MSGEGSTLRRRRLGLALRHLREQCGMTGQQAASALERSPSWISRLEAGRLGVRGLRVRELRDIFELYGVSDENTRAELEELAQEGRERRWWSKYADFISPDLAMYLGYENDAQSIWVYDANLIPGLLQTEAYMRSVLGQIVPPLAPDKIDAAVQIRLTRQQILAREHPAQCAIVLEEPAVRRPIGSAETRRDQVRALVAAARRPNIDLRVVPLARMRYALTSHAFTVMSFPDDPPIASEETAVVTLLHENRDAVKYHDIFLHVQAAALDAAASIALIEEVVSAI